MSELSAETSSEKLVLLLDGELSPTQEVPLFTDLASNDELRAEMRELISIKNIVRNDSEAFIPPFAATSAVFTSAGFSIPGLISGIGAILLKYSWIPVFLAVITGLTTYAILENHFESELNTVLLERSDLQKDLMQSKNTVAGLESQNNDLQNKLNNQKPETIVKYIRIPVVRSIENNNNNTSDAHPAVSNSQPETTDLFYSRASLNNYTLSNEFTANSDNSNILSTRPISSIYQPMANNIKVKNDVYYLTFSGISALSFPMVSSSTNTNGFSNLALGFYFLSPYKNIIIGGEFGKEPFSQSFINTENNKKFIYDQQPSIWWAGTSVIGTLDNKIEALFGAQPYGKLFIGGSELGPLGKVGAGFRWVSTSLGLGAFLGVEGSLLGYQNQGVWYSSGKVGFTYGLSIQF